MTFKMKGFSAFTKKEKEYIPQSQKENARLKDRVNQNIKGANEEWLAHSKTRPQEEGETGASHTGV